MINRANRIIIVGPHYSGPIMNISDGIRKLAPCTVVAPTDRISYSNIERSAIPAQDLKELSRQRLYFPAGEVLRLSDGIDESVLGDLNVSPRTKNLIRTALSIPLTAHDGYKTGKVRETDIIGIDPLASTELAAGKVKQGYFTLASVIDFAGKFWDLYRQGVFESAKRVDGQTDFGGFVLYLKPRDINVRTVFFPDGPETIYPIASETEAKAFGGHDPLTGCKHYEGMSGAKAGMLASDRTAFWSAWNFERFPESQRFGGFFNTLQAAGRIFMLGQTTLSEDDDPFIATQRASSVKQLVSYANSMHTKVWDPTAPLEMHEQTARKYVSL